MVRKFEDIFPSLSLSLSLPACHRHRLSGVMDHFASSSIFLSSPPPVFFLFLLPAHSERGERIEKKYTHGHAVLFYILYIVECCVCVQGANL